MELIKEKSGKVRDLYAVDINLGALDGASCKTDCIVSVASDRVSAFDSVLPGLEIPGKGAILTQLSRKWAELIDTGWKNQTVYGCTIPGTAYIEHCGIRHTSVVSHIRDELKRQGLGDNAQVMLELDMIPIECVVRGYITGSLWQAYHDDAITEFCGLPLPKGLRESDKLPEPLYAPTTKAKEGQHDENLTYAETIALIEDWRKERIAAGDHSKANYELWSAETIAKTLKVASIEYYRRASKWAEAHGVILADTKFEFGFNHGAICLGDEILTPDSSRFWPKDTYAPGQPQPSLDKQIIRDEVKRQKAAGVTEIQLSPEIVEKTKEAYSSCLQLLFP